MYDVVGLGELLVDFTPAGASISGNPLLEANPGGAPCNVLAMLAKCGKRTGFIGKVGKDSFGRMLEDTIQKAGIDTAGLSWSEEVPTTLAFVQIDEQGERSFSFYRNPGADMMLTEEDLSREMLENTKIFHFGSLSMTHPGVRQATKQATQWAKEAGALLSFDPNLRPLLWEDLQTAREQMLYGCSVCHILKVAEEELEFITGRETVEEGVNYLRERFHIPLILVTFGAKGSRAYLADRKVSVKAFLTPETVDTTGAGDTFCGCCLAYILEKGGLDDLTDTQLKEMLTFAGAAATLVTTQKGAIRSMPEIQQVKDFIAAYSN